MAEFSVGGFSGSAQDLRKRFTATTVGDRTKRTRFADALTFQESGGRFGKEFVPDPASASVARTPQQEVEDLIRGGGQPTQQQIGGAFGTDIDALQKLSSITPDAPKDAPPEPPPPPPPVPAAPDEVLAGPVVKTEEQLARERGLAQRDAQIEADIEAGKRTLTPVAQGPQTLTWGRISDAEGNAILELLQKLSDCWEVGDDVACDPEITDDSLC